MITSDSNGQKALRWLQALTPKQARWQLLEIAVLTSFAIGQPFLDLVGRNPAFFVAQRLAGWEAVFFGLAILFLPAAILGTLGLVVGRFNHNAGDWIHGVSVGALLALAVGPPLNRAFGIDGTASVGVLAVLAVLGTVAFHRASIMRTLIRMAVIGPIVFFGVFLLSIPSSASLGSVPIATASLERQDNPPIVWLILDQLPLALLIDDQGNLQSERYPGFARLAETATWYRRAVTVSPVTDIAIPSTLTGRYAKAFTPPDVGSYPINVFTLLDPAYEIYARETITALCASDTCAETSRARVQVRQLVSDSAVIATRLLLTDDLADRFLPEINDRWTGFQGGASGEVFHEVRVSGDDRWRFEEFLDDLGKGDRPAIHYLHQEKPHEPLLMLPGGQIYDFCSCYRTDSEGRWPEDPSMMNQRLQQYVLQTMYVDNQVSRLLDRLESSGLLDETLLVVMSDHGASMRPGEINRTLSTDTLSDVLPVPLFIKLPFQSEGRIDDLPASLIDVVPTIFDAIGAESPVGFEGRSLSRPAVDRDLLVITEDGPLVLDRPEATESPLVELATTLLPVPDNPFVFGEHGHLVGKIAAELVAGGSRLRAELAVHHSISVIDLDSDYLPAHVIGQLHGSDARTAIAVAFNGVIAGVGSTFGSDVSRISIMGDPSYFIDGENDISLYEIGADGLLEIGPPY